MQEATLDEGERVAAPAVHQRDSNVSDIVVQKAETRYHAAQQRTREEVQSEIRKREEQIRYMGIRTNQYEFRRGRSCEQAGQSLVKHAVEADERDKYCVAIFSDTNEAFDAVRHDELIHKLDRLGVRRKALQPIKSYLETGSRSTDLVTMPATRKSQPVKSGVA